jgi:hypothetical protein
MKPRRKKRRNLAWAKKIMGTSKQVVIARLFNIEKLARHLGVAETDDFDRFLIAWVWCNPKGDIGHLMDAARRMHGSLGREQAEAIMDEAEASNPQITAGQIGQYLGVTDEIRQRLKLWTIQPVDMTRRALMARRKRKGRERDERRRREKGAQPRTEYEANSLSRTKPWEAEGISRRTWERRRAAVDASPRAVPVGDRQASTLATRILSGGASGRASHHNLAAASTGKPSARTRHRVLAGCSAEACPSRPSSSRSRVPASSRRTLRTAEVAEGPVSIAATAWHGPAAILPPERSPRTTCYPTFYRLSSPHRPDDR